MTGLLLAAVLCAAAANTSNSKPARAAHARPAIKNVEGNGDAVIRKSNDRRPSIANPPKPLRARIEDGLHDAGESIREHLKKARAAIDDALRRLR